VATAGLDARAKATVAVAGPMDLGRVWRAYPGFEGFRAVSIPELRRDGEREADDV
jgi:hypothetical protein